MAQNALDLPKIYEVLAEYGEALRKVYRNNLASEDHNAGGTLSRTVEWKIDHSGRHYIVSLSLQNYWKYLEQGRPPGGKYPPIGKIREWVRIKPVIPKRDEKGKLPTIKQLAFLISRKIATEGIEPAMTLDHTVEQVNAEYLPKIRQAFAEDLETSLRATFQDVFHS